MKPASALTATALVVPALLAGLAGPAGAAAALAGPAANSKAGNVRMAAVSALLGFTCILPGPPPSGCRQAADHIVPASGQAVQYPAPDTPAAAATGAS